MAGFFFGIISGLSFIWAVSSPDNLNLTPQRLFVQLAFFTFFIAVAFYTIAITLNPMLPNMCAWVNIAFGALLGIYIWLLFNEPGLNKENGLIIQVTGQQNIAHTAIIFMFVTVYGSRDVVSIRCKESGQENLVEHRFTND